MTDLSGQYLGRYYLSERLGEGGMAVVYKAYDTRLERDVAIKIIRSGAFPPDAVAELLKRFEREAKSLAKLSHPNIVKVYDYGEHEGQAFLVMEYLPGGTLKKVLGRPVPWQDAVRLILPVARGVAYAHQRGVLHRDIKPANILITDAGEPMLSDFGIAKLFEGDQATALTGSGMAIGTPEYMAPEQWTGITTPQSDLYSLGIVLYEMVTGRKPYVADTPAAILIKQATEPLPGPRKFAADVPEALEQVLIKALAKEPDDRYRDLKAFISALENLFASVPLVQHHPEQVRLEETVKTPPPQSAIRASTQTVPWRDAETVRAVDAHEKAPKEQTKDDKKPVMAERPAVRIPDPSGFLTRLKSWTGRFQSGQTGKRLKPSYLITMALVVVLGFAVVSSRLAKALPLVFTGNSEDQVTIYQYGGKKSISLLQPSKDVESWAPAVGISGNVYFTSNRDGKAEIYRLIDGNVERITHTPKDFESWSPVLSPSGNIYFTSNRDGKVEIYRLVNGNTERVTNTAGKLESWGPALGASGNIYFTSNRDGKFEIYRSIDGQIERVTNTPARFESWAPAVSSSGNIYFTSNRDGKAEIYRVIDGQTERVTNTPGKFESWGVVVLGRKVYFTSNRSGHDQVYVLTPEISIISDLTGWTKTLIAKLPEY